MHALQGESQALCAIAGDIHGIPLFLETLLDEARDLLLVFDDQEAHRWHPHSALLDDVS